MGSDPNCPDNMSDDDCLNETTTYRHKDAKYFMSLEADHKMTKTSINNVAASNKHLMATVVAKCTSKIEKLLRDLNLSDCDINDVVTHFNSEMCNELCRYISY